MARSRNIKPGFFSNEDLAECSPWARLCFIGLWTLADREGRLEDRVKRIKGELFAFETFDAEPLLRELERHAFIERYEIEGQRFIQISKFAVHQTPHYSEKPSVIKPPRFQESQAHEDVPRPENSAEEASLRGGRNPLIPDSLIPDSPNHERGTLIPESGERAPARAGPPDVDLLVAAGFDAKSARDFIAHKAAVKAPLTDRAWRDHLAEAAKAGWTPLAAAEKVMAKSWKGFEAKYVAAEPAHNRKGNGAAKTAREESAAASADAKRRLGIEVNDG